MGSVHLFVLFHFSNEHLLTPVAFFLFVLLNMLGFPCKTFFGKWQFGKGTAEVVSAFGFLHLHCFLYFCFLSIFFPVFIGP